MSSFDTDNQRLIMSAPPRVIVLNPRALVGTRPSSMCR